MRSKKTALFLLIILTLIDASAVAAAKRPKGAVVPGDLPGMTDAKLPAYAVKASTAAGTDAALVAPPLPADQTVPGCGPEKKGSIPLPSLKIVALGDAPPGLTPAAPAVAASTATAAVPADGTDTMLQSAPLPVQTTSQAVIETMDLPAAAQTTAQMRTVLLVPQTTVATVAPTAAPDTEGAFAVVPALLPQTTGALENVLLSGTTKTMAEETAGEQALPAASVTAPATAAAPEEKTLRPAPHKEDAGKRAVLPAPRKAAPPAGPARAALPAPVARPLPKKEETKDASREPLARVYRVAAGDTLPRLAERYYGDKDEWFRIYEANKDHIEKGSLQKGQILLIP